MKTITIGKLEKLGAIVEIQDGNHGELHPKASEYIQSGVPFVMASDVRNNQLVLSTCHHLPKNLTDRLRIGFARSGDVLLTHKGTVGETAIVPQINEYVMLTPQVTYYRTDKTKLLNRYLSLAFRSPFFQQQLNSVSAQSTRPYVGITAQRHLQIEFREIEEQHRIASILSAYDDLIENNTRRIAILEEMARRIYEEWFVRFRFPGHEGVRMVESELGLVPEGWSVVPLNQVLVLQRGFDLPSRERLDGPYPVIAASGEHGTHREAKVKGPGVVTGRSGSLGKVLYVTGDFWPLNTTLWVKEFCVDSPIFAFYVLSSIDLAGFNSGAAVPTLNRNDIHKLPVSKPTDDVLKKFNSMIEPIIQLKQTLTTKNTNLRTTRDLLLPKLISGELDVSNMPETNEVTS